MKTLNLCNCSQLHGTGYLEGKLGMYGKAAKREREQDNSCCSRSQGLMEDSKYIGRGEPSPKGWELATEPVWLLSRRLVYLRKLQVLEEQWASPWSERSTLSGGDNG